MNATSAVTVKILEKDYRILCAPEQQQTLLLSAQRLDRQMKEIRDAGKVIGAEKIAVLAALNLAHEISADMDDQPAETLQKIISLRSKIENILNGE